MGYFKDTVRGLKWMGAFKLISRVVSFLRIAILTRILSPVQFGIFAVASLSLSFLETFTETGIGVFLIQAKEDIEKYVDSAWIISIVRGIVIFILVYFGASKISYFFNSPDSYLLLRVVALVALVRGFINPSRIYFIKNLNFKGEFKISVIVLMVDLITTVAATILLRNPIALVYGLLFGAMTEVVLSLIIIKPRPKLKFKKNIFRIIIKTGKWITASTIFNYLFSEGDDAIVAKLLSKFDLGIYQLSYKISILPLTEVTQVINSVVFPVYVKIRDDTPRLRSAFLKTLIVVILLTTFICSIIFMFPKIIVNVLLGESWKSAAQYIQLLAFFGLFRSIAVSCNPLFNALHKQRYITYYSFVAFFSMVITIFPLMNKYGLRGTIISVIIGSFIALFLNLVNVYRIIR